MTGNKGSAIDIFWIVIAMLVVGIMALVGTYIKDQVYPMIQGFTGDDTEAAGIMNTAAQGIGMMDNLFMMTYFMMAGAAIVFAALVRNHPIYFVLNLILLMILFLITPAISNVMRAFWNTPEFAPYAAGGAGSVTFPIMTRMFQWLPAITVGVSILLMVVQFSKGFGASEL